MTQMVGKNENDEQGKLAFWKSISACQFAHFSPCVCVWVHAGVSVMQTCLAGKAALFAISVIHRRWELVLDLGPLSPIQMNMLSMLSVLFS